MPLSEIAAGLSGLAVIAGGLSAFFVLRIQRDMAKLKVELLEAINGKYLTRKESELMDRERSKWDAAMEDHFNRIEKQIREQREAAETLREDFIRFRAAKMEACE